jgi:Bacterial Ig-like domain
MEGETVTNAQTTKKTNHYFGALVLMAAFALAASLLLTQAERTTTVRVRKAGTSTNLGATVTYDSANKEAILNPKANLSLGATYEATITTGTKDLAGNALDQKPGISCNQSKVWRFTIKK